jgi:hypothetical protein
VHYTAGPASLMAFASADELRHAKIFWSGAWVLLDAAGGLFALYFLSMVGLLLVGIAARFWARRRAR